MLSLGSDIRFALRLLRKTPGFSVAVLAVLALGIGANAALFSTLDQTVIRPLPYADPSRLAGVFESIALFPRSNLSYLDYLDWKRRNVSTKRRSGSLPQVLSRKEARSSGCTSSAASNSSSTLA